MVICGVACFHIGTAIGTVLCFMQCGCRSHAETSEPAQWKTALFCIVRSARSLARWVACIPLWRSSPVCRVIPREPIAHSHSSRGVARRPPVAFCPHPWGFPPSTLAALKPAASFPMYEDIILEGPDAIAQIALAQAERWDHAQWAALHELKGEAAKVVGVKSAARWRKAVQRRTLEIYSRLQ